MDYTRQNPVRTPQEQRDIDAAVKVLSYHSPYDTLIAHVEVIRSGLPTQSEEFKHLSSVLVNLLKVRYRIGYEVREGV